MKPNKQKPFALLMRWAGRDRWYIYAAIVMALLSSLCSIVPYFAFYQVADGVASGTCTVDFALHWAAEAGTHDQLLAKGGKYAAMWEASRLLK